MRMACDTPRYSSPYRVAPRCADVCCVMSQYTSSSEIRVCHGLLSGVRCFEELGRFPVVVSEWSLALGPLAEHASSERPGGAVGARRLFGAAQLEALHIVGWAAVRQG